MIAGRKKSPSLISTIYLIIGAIIIRICTKENTESVLKILQWIVVQKVEEENLKENYPWD